MAQPLDPPDWRRVMAPRLNILGVSFALCVVAIGVRLVYIQVVDHEFYVKQSVKQQQSVVKLSAERGEILDRNGKVLATSVGADDLYVTRVKVTDPAKAAALICGALRDCDSKMRADLVRNLAIRKGESRVRGQINPEQARRLKALELEAIYLRPVRHRWYPNSELAAHVIGFVGNDDKGLAGIEETYESVLSGTPSKVLVQLDGQRERFNLVGSPPVPGKTLELTIDANLQYIAERELRAGIQENLAIGGSVVILDPWSGEILAMASYPTFNANLFGRATDEQRMNRPVQVMYEPGSTFKIVTASAALEEKVMAPGDLVDTNPGYIRLAGNRLVDEYHGHVYGVISFSDVIVKSSNVGAIKIGFDIGAERLGRYVASFGFGSRLSPDFRAEARGQVWPSSKWSESTLASVAMGYEISVTALQMAAAASAVANGGELIQPRVVRAVIDGNRRSLVPRKVLRRVISAQTAWQLTSMMEGVVEKGTATKAQLADFTVAGKTGTSNKNRNGRYVEEYNTSFVGFVPSRKPALTVLVHIDTPRGPNPKAGGAVAAPVFHRIADAALRYLGVAPTINPAPPVLVARQQAEKAMPVSGPSVPLTIVPVSAPVSAGQIVLPDLRGLSGREALRILSRLGITPRMTGDGVVADQDPAPFTPIDIGGTCRLALGRPAPGIQP